MTLKCFKILLVWHCMRNARPLGGVNHTPQRSGCPTLRLPSATEVPWHVIRLNVCDKKVPTCIKSTAIAWDWSVWTQGQIPYTLRSCPPKEIQAPIPEFVWCRTESTDLQPEASIQVKPRSRGHVSGKVLVGSLSGSTSHILSGCPTNSNKTRAQNFWTFPRCCWPAASAQKAFRFIPKFDTSMCRLNAWKKRLQIFSVLRESHECVPRKCLKKATNFSSQIEA